MKFNNMIGETKFKQKVIKDCMSIMTRNSYIYIYICKGDNKTV